MASETSWLERVLIALSESDLNLLNEYNSTLTRKLHSAQKCSDEDLILFLADKREVYNRVIWDNFLLLTFIFIKRIPANSKTFTHTPKYPYDPHSY